MIAGHILIYLNNNNNRRDAFRSGKLLSEITLETNSKGQCELQPWLLKKKKEKKKKCDIQSFHVFNNFIIIFLLSKLYYTFC